MPMTLNGKSGNIFRRWNKFQNHYVHCGLSVRPADAIYKVSFILGKKCELFPEFQETLHNGIINVVPAWKWFLL